MHYASQLRFHYIRIVCVDNSYFRYFFTRHIRCVYHSDLDFRSSVESTLCHKYGLGEQCHILSFLLC